MDAHGYMMHLGDAVPVSRPPWTSQEMDYLRTHPGAKAATFKDGQCIVTQAGGELIKDADGVYRPTRR